MAEPRSTASYLQLDTSQLLGIAQQNQAYNRKINAGKAARSATGAAKINESFDKLNKKVWERDNQYMSELISDTENFMIESYSKYGENSLYDNPELKAEFQSRLSNMKNFGEMSRSQQAMGNKQLEERAKNPEELNYESAAEIDRWMDLPSEQRVLTPIPMMSKRHTTLSEAVNKYGKQHLDGLLTDFKSEGAIDEETGEYSTYEGKRFNVKKLNELVESYNTNPTSVIFRTADREAREDFDYEQTSPIMIDAQGNKIPNPAFQEQISKARAERIKEEVLLQAGQAYTKSGRKFTPGSAAKEKVEITEVSPDKAGFTTEEIPEQFSKNVRFSGTAKDETGKLYYKLKTPSFQFEGKLYANAKELPKGITTEDATEVPIGSYIDKSGNIKPDDSDLTETKDLKTIKATREINVTSTGKPKVINIKEYYNPKGELIEVKEGTALEGVMIGHLETKDGDITKIRNKKGEVVLVPTDDSIRKTFKTEYSKIDANSGVSYKETTTKKSSGINW